MRVAEWGGYCWCRLLVGGDGGCEVIVVFIVGCWRVGEIGADDCSCAAVEDVLQDVGRWFAAWSWWG